jgi:hypothetical protein
MITCVCSTDPGFAYTKLPEIKFPAKFQSSGQYSICDPAFRIPLKAKRKKALS